MSLSDHANTKGQPRVSNEDLETNLRGQLAPLIEFLERAAKVDDGYPDAYPKEQRETEQEAGQYEYREHGLNNTYIGCTLENLVGFNEYGETHDARNGHGRYMEASAWVQDHRIHDSSPGRIFSFTLFEDGKKYVGLDAYHKGIEHDFNRAEDVTSAMRDIIHDYVRASARVDGNIDAAFERGQALIDIANEMRAKYFGAYNKLEIYLEGAELKTGLASTATDSNEHTAD